MRTDAFIKSGFAFVVSVDGYDTTLRMEAICYCLEQKSKIKPGASSTDSDQQHVN